MLEETVLDQVFADLVENLSLGLYVDIPLFGELPHLLHYRVTVKQFQARALVWWHTDLHIQ